MILIFDTSNFITQFKKFELITEFVNVTNKVKQTKKPELVWPEKSGPL